MAAGLSCTKNTVMTSSAATGNGVVGHAKSCRSKRVCILVAIITFIACGDMIHFLAYCTNFNVNRVAAMAGLTLRVYCIMTKQILRKRYTTSMAETTILGCGQMSTRLAI